MMCPMKDHAPCRGAAFLLAGLMLLGGDSGTGLRAASAQTTTDRMAVFDMDGKQIIQDEVHLGIVNGKLAAGINYRDVAGVGGLWSPPYVSSNFLLDGRVNGEKVPTTKWTWRPFQVEREGNRGPVAVSSTTTMIYGHRAAVVSFTFKNSGRTAVPVEFLTLGWLDSVRDWGFARPASSTETTLQADGRRLTLRQGQVAIVLAIDSDEWKWETSGNLGHAVASLPAKQSRSVNVIIAIGSGDKAAASVNQVLADPAGAIAAAGREYARQVGEVFEKLPSLESDNAQLVRWYHRSLVHFLMNRWEVPEFALQPYYSTGSVNGGCVANYLWNFGEAWEIFPLFDAPAARTHIKQFLKGDLLKHFYFSPITGTAGGTWYMINQEKIIERLYQAGQPRLAADILGRLLWWSDTMPYWGDSIAANCKDYRRDTPLQCTFDGVAAAQCVIFGVFGVSVQPDGDIVIQPSRLPFARQLALNGLKIRGRSLDIRIDERHCEVRSGGRTIRASTGGSVVVSTKDGALRLAN